MNGETNGRPEKHPRWFNDPYSSWRMRALPKWAYSLDIDNVEVVGTEPILFYEIKKIPFDLVGAIKKGENTPSMRNDLLGRLDSWQLLTECNVAAERPLMVLFVAQDMSIIAPGLVVKLLLKSDDRQLWFLPYYAKRQVGKYLEWGEEASGLAWNLPLIFVPADRWAVDLLHMRANWQERGELWPPSLAA